MLSADQRITLLNFASQNRGILTDDQVIERAVAWAQWCDSGEVIVTGLDPMLKPKPGTPPAI